MEMELSKSASWQIYKLSIARRNLIFLSVIVWLFVLYFSLYGDGIDAFLSFIAVSLTVYAFRGMGCICDEFAYFLNVTSKVLILAGISLVTFSNFWNTAFYSICLGFLIQKMMYDMELQARNVNPDLNVQASLEVAENDAFDDLKQLTAREPLRLRKVMQDIQEYEMKELNVDKRKSAILDALNEMQLQSTPEEGQIKEIQSSHKKSNEPHLDVSETVSDPDEILSIEDFLSHFPELSEKNMFRDENIKTSSDSLLESDESSLTYSGTLLESDMIRTLEFKLLDLKESSLDKLSKIYDKFDLNASDIERELKEKEVADMDTSEQSVTLNVEMVNVASPENDIKQLNVIGNTVECLDEQENKVYKELFNESINISSDAYSDRPLDFIQNNDLISSCSYKNLYRQDQNEIKQELLENKNKCIESEYEPENKVKRELFNKHENTRSKAYTWNSHVTQKNDLISSCINKNSCHQINQVKEKSDLKSFHSVKNVDSPLLNKTERSDIDLRNQGSSGEVNSTNFDIDRKKSLMNESSLQAISLKTNEMLGSKTKYSSLKCTSVETADIQPEKETCAYHLKCISVDDVNPDIGNFSSKKDELADDADKRNLTLESGKQESGDVGATLIACSNVEDVVNRIDSRFIYGLYMNVPSTTNQF